MRTLRASLAAAALVAVALFVPATASAAPITADDPVDIVTVVAHRLPPPTSLSSPCRIKLERRLRLPGGF